MKFLHNSLSLETDDCIEWLYSKNTRGYGTVNKKNQVSQIATRVVLHKLNIANPEKKPYVLHSCNNPPCINKRHLRYGTAKDNADDRAKAGRTARGNQTNSHLSAEVVREVRKTRGTNKEVGRLFGIAPNTVCLIQNRKRWGWLE